MCYVHWPNKRSVALCCLLMAFLRNAWFEKNSIPFDCFSIKVIIALWCVLKKNWKISNPSSYFLWFWQYFGILWQDWISIFATTCHNLSYLWPKFRNLLCKLDFFYLKLNCNACFLSSHAELSSEKTK